MKEKIAFNEKAPFVLKQIYGEHPHTKGNLTIWAPKYATVLDVDHKKTDAALINQFIVNNKKQLLFLILCIYSTLVMNNNQPSCTVVMAFDL